MTGSGQRLPGELLMWILIASELAVFGAGLVAFLGMRIPEAEAFAASQALLDRRAGALNTLVLVTSGFLAARAVRHATRGERRPARLSIAGAMALGVVFLAVKLREYSDKAAQGIGIETDTFFTFYYLLTGFHALHVVAGIVILGITAVKLVPEHTEAAAQFWHMVDMVWVLLFPVIYLLR